MLQSSIASFGASMVSSAISMKQQIDQYSDQVYSKVYQTTVQKMNLTAQQSAARQNIMAVKQDQISTNAKIQQQRDQAKASKEVQAAAAGTAGGSVDATLRSSDRAAAFALQQVDYAAEAQTDALVSQIGNMEAQKYMLDAGVDQMIDNNVSGWGMLGGIFESGGVQSLIDGYGLSEED